MPFLIFEFLFLSLVIWIAGIYLTKSTANISDKVGLSEVFGGMVILTIVTNLPEAGIMASSAINGELEIGISNILGGIAVQTVVICLYDFFRVDRTRAYTTEASSNQVIVLGLLTILILALVIMSNNVNLSVGRIPVMDTAIAVIWIMGIIIISHDKRATLPSHAQSLKSHHRLMRIKCDRDLGIFLVSSLATFLAGYYIVDVSSNLAKELGMTGIVFGATILALVTSLPEVSTGLEAVWLKRNKLAITDVFGGNAFLPCLFFPTALYVGHSVVSKLQKEDVYLTALGIVLTVIYVIGLVIRTKREFLGIGFDTVAVLLFYTIGIVGLLYMS